MPREDFRPFISVLMPSYNSDLNYLQEAIDSVITQTYQHWELCIADDASNEPEVRTILQRYNDLDDRVRVIIRERNGHISEASNSALELATGGWVALMDHDDLLSPTALHEVAAAIRANQRIRLIYSDEDKIDESGKRHDPYYKPSWNRDLLYSQNFISHLAVYHAPTVRKIRGFRKGLEGAQDYDLALRFIEQINDDQIYHIPKILYHWRSHLESTASTGDAKPYAVTAGECAINDHLQRTGSAGRCAHDGAGGYRVQYPLPESEISASALIVSNGNGRDLHRCIEAIERRASSIIWGFHVLPSNPRAERLIHGAELPPKTLLETRDEGESFSSFLNRISQNTAAQVLWYLHDQLQGLGDGVIDELIAHALRPEIGATSGMLLYPGGRVRQAGLLLNHERISCPSFQHCDGDSRGSMGRLTLIQNYSAVSKDCMVIEKKKFQEVGGFDEAHLKSNYLDVDLCLRLKALGYRTLWTPYARFRDLGPRFSLSGISDRFSQEFRQDCTYMQSRWSDDLKNDPAYNPNLNQRKKDFSFKWPQEEKG